MTGRKGVNLKVCFLPVTLQAWDVNQITYSAIVISVTWNKSMMVLYRFWKIQFVAHLIISCVLHAISCNRVTNFVCMWCLRACNHVLCINISLRLCFSYPLSSSRMCVILCFYSIPPSISCSPTHSHIHREEKSPFVGRLLRRLPTESSHQPVMCGATVLSCGKWCHMASGRTGTWATKM